MNGPWKTFRWGGRVLLALLLIPASFLVASHLAAQEYTHPTLLSMPEPRDPRPDPMDVRVELENGVVVYVVPDATVPLVTVSVFLAAGRAHGAPGAADALAGVLRSRGPAGFQGPTAFQGPGQLSWGERLREMNALLRVEVGAEEMEVTLDLPAHRAAEGLDLLARLLTSPALDGVEPEGLLGGVIRRSPSEMAAGESGPVLYEGSLDEAVRLFHDHLLEGTRYAPSLSPGEAAALTLPQLRAFHAYATREARMVVALSGDFQRRDAEAWLQGSFGAGDFRGVEPAGEGPEGRRQGDAVPPGGVAMELRPELVGGAPSPWPPRSGVLYPVDKLQGWVVLGHELPPVPLEDEAPLWVMNYILGGGHFDARLFIEVRDKRGLANTAGAFPSPNRAGPGAYTFRTYGRPETVPLLIRILQDEIQRIRDEPVSPEELQVAQGAYAEGEYGMWFHNGEATARTLAREWLHSGQHDGTASFRERIRQVTVADVQRVARSYLHPGDLRMVLVGPWEAIQEVPALDGEPPVADFGEIWVVR
ncbi:MAG: pitrilysin family protein [Gemmatimonadota bacterium]